MLVFILLYVPCVAAVSTLAREMNSVKWTLFSIAWQIGIAYTAAFLVHTMRPAVRLCVIRSSDHFRDF